MQLLFQVVWSLKGCSNRHGPTWHGTRQRGKPAWWSASGKQWGIWDLLSEARGGCRGDILMRLFNAYWCAVWSRAYLNCKGIPCRSKLRVFATVHAMISHDVIFFGMWMFADFCCVKMQELWQEFMHTLRSPMPLVVRINRTKPHWQEKHSFILVHMFILL